MSKSKIGIDNGEEFACGCDNAYEVAIKDADAEEDAYLTEGAGAPVHNTIK